MCSACSDRKCNEIYQLNCLGKVQFEIPLNKKPAETLVSW